MEELTTQDQIAGSPADQVSSVFLILGPFAGPDVELRLLRPTREVAIGRGQAGGDVDFWRVEDATVSRQHGRVTNESGTFFVEDLGSRNGTWVEGLTLRGEKTRLRSGALLVVGEAAALFRVMTNDDLSAIRNDQERPMGPVATASALLAGALRRLRLLARTDQPILLAGETGTGKEVYARAVHVLSGRPGPFVAINCASFQRELFESQLFGYKRGSHSQASEDHPGILATAEGGTLFLDEIGEMEPSLQTKLLRFLQEKTFFGIGSTRARRADVRILAATQSPRGTLRKDILGRFGADAVVLPPLRKRREDLPALCRHFLRRASGDSRVTGLEREVCLTLCLYRWPRNIRELEATLLEAALSAAERGATRIGLRDLPRRIRDAAGTASASDAPEPTPTGTAHPAPPPRAAAAEQAPPREERPRPSRAELEALLRAHGGQVPAVARHLQRRREVVWRWCRILSIDPTAFRVEDDAARAEESPPAEQRTPGRNKAHVPHR